MSYCVLTNLTVYDLPACVTFSASLDFEVGDWQYSVGFQSTFAAVVNDIFYGRRIMSYLFRRHVVILVRSKCEKIDT